jgi:hypothetical protein
MLCFRSFKVLHFIFRPMIHFGLILVKGVKSVCRYMVMHEDVQLSCGVEKTLLSLLNCLCFFVKDQLTVFI